MTTTNCDLTDCTEPWVVSMNGEKLCLEHFNLRLREVRVLAEKLAGFIGS